MKVIRVLSSLLKEYCGLVPTSVRVQPQARYEECGSPKPKSLFAEQLTDSSENRCDCWGQFRGVGLHVTLSHVVTAH